MFATLVLAQLLRECAANVDARTMTAVVRVESGGNVLALHDNTLRRSFAPADNVEAVAWANQLIRLGHSVDIGLSQINSANLPGLGIGIGAAFEPCTNLHAGATILGNDYFSAARTFGPGQIALRHALGAYNTGSFFAGQGYINQILAAAGMPPEYGIADAAPAAAAAPAHAMYVTRHVAGSPVEIILGK
ncbi:MAG: lytic transglycosylase domain-containing protein [Candidatus Eremiobacteraeota bacterium]|nr:lytic transglycosylase domain-containing protein [Candidatus Eremiobacteraeota bacterium]